VLLVKHHVRHGTVLLGLYVSHENGGGSLQKNFNAGELRYVRNIPGGRRQRASAAATSELTSGLLRTSAIPASASASALTSVVGVVANSMGRPMNSCSARAPKFGRN
jgi:hypothetical protein